MSAAEEWSARMAAQDQALPALRGTIQDRLVERMDPEVANSFTKAQLLELERVLSAPSRRRLPIDIRLTVPLLRHRYFLTLLATPERRSAARLKAERATREPWSFGNICFFVFLLVLFVPAVIGLARLTSARF